MPATPVKFPVDFEEKVKRPPAPGGDGYPYQLSAKDLMDNYKMAALLVDDTAIGGLKLKETLKNGTRSVALDGTLDGMLPAGSAGDMLYHDGSTWTVLAAPSASGTFVLGTVDGSLQWMTTEEC